MRVAAMLMAAGMMAAMPVSAASEGAMKTCGAAYQAAKAAKSLAPGETWPHFLATCRAGLPRATAAPTPGQADGSTSTAQAAARGRMKQCSAQWKVDKAAGRTGDRRWPAYWGACSARLKAGG